MVDFSLIGKEVYFNDKHNNRIIGIIVGYHVSLDHINDVWYIINLQDYQHKYGHKIGYSVLMIREEDRILANVDSVRDSLVYVLDELLEFVEEE